MDPRRSKTIADQIDAADQGEVADAIAMNGDLARLIADNYLADHGHLSPASLVNDFLNLDLFEREEFLALLSGECRRLGHTI